MRKTVLCWYTNSESVTCSVTVCRFSIENRRTEAVRLGPFVFCASSWLAGNLLVSSPDPFSYNGKCEVRAWHLYYIYSASILVSEYAQVTIQVKSQQHHLMYQAANIPYAVFPSSVSFPNSRSLVFTAKYSSHCLQPSEMKRIAAVNSPVSSFFLCIIVGFA